MNVNASSSLQPRGFLEDSRIQGLRDAMGMQLVADTRQVGADGTVHGYTAVKSKGGKEELLDSARLSGEALKEMREKRAEESRESRENDAFHATSDATVFATEKGKEKTRGETATVDSQSTEAMGINFLA